MKNVYFSLLLTLIIAITNQNCTTETKKDSPDLSNLNHNDHTQEAFDKAKLVFYSLPSPIETTLLLKRANADFNEEIINPTANSANYVTNKQMALNLGIYGADLSYASLFDQQQLLISYMNVAQRLAKQLGITDALDESTINRLKENLNNKNAVMGIISETFMNSSAHLNENNRAEIAAMIVTGGWIEGLYIALKLTENSNIVNEELINTIIYQKLSLSDLLGLLDIYKSNNDIKSLNDEMLKLKDVYENIKITSTKIEPVIDKNNNKTTLKSRAETSITPEDMKKLKEITYKIRNSFVLN